MRLQVVSDVHLEFKNARDSMPEIEVKSDVLCLLGDIGYPFRPSYKEFIEYQSSRFLHVIVLVGNHEFYCPDDIEPTYTFEEVLEQVEAICGCFDNVQFLYRRSLELPCLPGVKIVGVTLWSDIPEKFKYDLADMCNDYSYIYTRCDSDVLTSLLPSSAIKWNQENTQSTVEPRLLSVEQQNLLHRKDVAFITNEIQDAVISDKKVIILTHHAPTDDNTVPEDEDWEPLRYMNFSKLENFFVDPVKVWAFGHTHCSSYAKHEDCIVVSNQLGYVKHHDPKFSNDLVVQFTC